jgi:hypothetical protein
MLVFEMDTAELDKLLVVEAGVVYDAGRLVFPLASAVVKDTPDAGESVSNGDSAAS